MSKTLDPTVVAEAGVALVGEHGVQALSLRAVAGSLGVTPMALYRHVADSEALSEAVMDSIVRGSARIRNTGDAAEDLADWARHFHSDLMAFPGVAGWLLSHWFECGPMLERIDELLCSVSEHGLDGFEAVAVTNAVFTYVLMRCEAEREVRSKGAVKRQLRMSKAGRPLTRLSALAGHYTTAEFDAHFEFGLHALVSGMHLPAGTRS